jgi:lipopolysaccharide/colanic/teichoic acid biosynthesis glycosyltransferase
VSAAIVSQPAKPVEVVRKVLDAAAADRLAPVGGWSKRAFDVCASSAALVILAPLLACIAIAVRLDSPGQSIFRQERGGFGGRTFRIWKFRTMSVTENRGVVQARHHDARITRLGSFLRRSSWDELPQLINVLMGDMSIIGPRPHALEHDIYFNKVDPTYAQRFIARPGVTGLAQVNGCRGPTETEEKVKARTAYDVEYVRRWTWAREIEIVFATVALLFWKKDPGAL